MKEKAEYIDPDGVYYHNHGAFCLDSSGGGDA